MLRHIIRRIVKLYQPNRRETRTEHALFCRPTSSKQIQYALDYIGPKRQMMVTPQEDTKTINVL